MATQCIINGETTIHPILIIIQSLRPELKLTIHPGLLYDSPIDWIKYHKTTIIALNNQLQKIHLIKTTYHPYGNESIVTEYPIGHPHLIQLINQYLSNFPPGNT